MNLRAYLSSLRSTYYFMLSFGLLMGLIFPFYSALFFGARAFTPLYVIGCLVAGVLVGTFCYYIIKQVMKFYLERQWQALSRLATSDCDTVLTGKGDELNALMGCYDTMLEKVLSMVQNISILMDRSAPLNRHLQEKSLTMVTGNEQQAAKEEETMRAVEEMNTFLNVLIREIEELAVRTDERASISTEMSATTDTIAENIKDYSSAVLETSASIEEMAVSIRQSADNIEALAVSTEQTSSSITQISAAISNVRDNAQRTAECSEGVRKQAVDGLQSMASTVKAMNAIEKSTEESYEAIHRLSVHSARIGSFLEVIQEVVEQTNLLSLNASIIAAQAGERGKAFAVVAEEVRSLAHRTAQSAREIDDLVKDIQKETAAVQSSVAQGKDRIKEGVKISALTNEALVRIEAGAEEASSMVQKIATATVEQAAGSRLITDEAAKNLDRAKQVTRATQEQERGISMIVKALEQMRLLSQKITNSAQEQSRGNRLYLKSVLEDNEKVKRLRDTSIQQIMMGDVLLNYVREAGRLIESNAELAKQNMVEIEAITGLNEKLQKELSPFRSQAGEP